ncbi:MAG: metallophosphoesterase [Thermoflexales bacterium]|nr:metallophosphoesterase [Thermoflexales bacterium]
MKILALSDQVVESIYSAEVRERFGDVDLLLSCGDLPYSYLEYVVTMLGVPAFYVHGNHDLPEDLGRGELLYAPRGWVDLDGRTARVGPLLLAGLEGALRYRPDAPFQYSEGEMRWKVVRLLPALLLNRLRYGRYLDVLVTHAPPLGIHNDLDLPHRGFAVFRWLMERFRPRYLLHGHKHVYKPQTTRTRYGETLVVNVYPFAVLEL